MTIRPATVADLDVLTAMGEHFLAQTEYRDRLDVSVPHLRAFAERCVTQAIGESDILVSEAGGAVTGMIGLLVTAHPFSGERIAGELFWWVEPAQRGHGVRLMRAAEAWARARGAARFQMVAPNDRVAQFYDACGYTRLEATYQRSL